MNSTRELPCDVLRHSDWQQFIDVCEKLRISPSMVLRANEWRDKHTVRRRAKALQQLSQNGWDILMVNLCCAGMTKYAFVTVAF